MSAVHKGAGHEGNAPYDEADIKFNRSQGARKSIRMKAMRRGALSRLTEVPTVSESGLLGPVGLPKPILDKLQGTIAAMFRNPDKPLLDQFTALGIVPTPLDTSEQFGEY